MAESINIFGNRVANNMTNPPSLTPTAPGNGMADTAIYKMA